ncbi:hypothetical protein Daus18300_000538 [Diaporthe australafricana]|uniref:Uncharacterized protein n=1 Tax=Diaporthe australafricana TaxID=127596 RepID=A0ABR3Y4M9_9PEZI
MVPSRADPWQPLSCPPRSSLRLLPSLRLLGLFFILGILASQAGLCAADTSTGDQNSVTWIFPQGEEVFQYLDTVNVSYQSLYPDPWMYTFCYENQTANTVRQIRMQEAKGFDAFILIPLNFSTSTPCWFNLRENTSENKGSNSNKWNLTQVQRESGPITTGAPVPSATTTTSLPSSSFPTASASTSAGASASTTATVSTSNTSNDGFSSGAKAGLGIGVGLATAAVCAGLFWLYYRHIKRKEHHQEVYRRIVGGQGGAAGATQDAFKPPDEHLEPWRYGNTPQPAPSAISSAYSGVSDPSSTNWYQSEVTVGAPYQYYDPVGSSQHVAPGHHYPAESVAGGSVAALSVSAAPPASVVRGYSNPRANTTPEPPVPEAAAIRDVQDLNSSLYPSEFNEPPSPVSPAHISPATPPRHSSVNYGPAGRLDASTGADFALLPEYTSPPGGSGGRADDPDDLYGPATPRSPPPPHSAHVRTVMNFPPEQGHSGQLLASLDAHDVVVSELPTAQTHRGFGPQAELPADEVPQPVARHTRRDLQGAEQKFLVRDVARLRTGQHRDGG